MDQGDNQLPMWQGDFDMNWSLIEDDWASRATAPKYFSQADYPTVPNSAEPQNWNLNSSPLSASRFDTFAGLPEKIFAENDPLVSPLQQSKHLLTHQTFFQNPTSNPRWPMWYPSEQLVQTYGFWPTLGCQVNGGTDYCNDQVGEVPFGNEWPKSNCVGGGLLDNCSGINSGLSIPSDFPSFTETEELHFDQRSSTGGAKEKQDLPARSTVLDGGRKSKRTKQRLLCNYPGCKSTFPRKYELERHQSNVHDRDFSLCCIVFECRRSAKPFHREDKFKEHMRTHHDPRHFVCVIDGCVEAPMTRTELKDHFRATHGLEHCNQPHLDIALAALNLRPTRLRDASVLLEDSDKCPLAFLGCDFRDSTRNFARHVVDHELVERSEGYEGIIEICGWWMGWGLCTCPICHKKVARDSNPEDLRPLNRQFLVHLENHSKEERALHAAPISKMLRPYLIGKETSYDAYIFHKLRAELEEVAAFQSGGTILHEGATAGNNQ